MPKKSKNIDEYLCRRGTIVNRLSRIRYFRGHGVHSPYVYSITRDIFMRRRCDAALLDVEFIAQLESNGMSKRRAIEIARLADHCNIKRREFDTYTDGDMVIATQNLCDNDVKSIIRSATNCGVAIVILKPYNRRTLCNDILKHHTSTSIDRYDYILLLNNHLPKQHFRL